MTPEQFCYWLRGRAELQPDNRPSAKEWKMIKDNLQAVFEENYKIRLLDSPSPAPQWRNQPSTYQELGCRVDSQPIPYPHKPST
jgi:hypothetical protein